ncbi:MAG: helix-turn-helix transcriptional regulator [Caldilineaceae bacterium]|nr:helix-turn-helix transcriptional regulator [Caldilineaceae bacterium]
MSALSAGQTVRYLREEKGVTLKELGNRSGMPAGFLYQVENGRQGIGENRLRQWADAPDAWNGLFPPEPEGRMRIVSIPGEGPLSETVTEGVRPGRVATSFYQGSPAHAGTDRARDL